MLKYFYKTFLISILCGSLTLLNVPLYAQDDSPAPTEQPASQPTVQPQAGSTGENQKATALMSKSVDPNVTRDANGVLTSHESKTFSGAKVNDDGPLHIITMLAIGVIGTKLLMYKKWTMDMTIVAAASAAYIAAEIINIMNLKNEIKGMSMDVARRSDGKVDQEQIETLEKLKESYQKVQKSARTKMMLQKAAGVAYGAALAVAAYQSWSEDGKFASCEAAAVTAEEQLLAGAAAATASQNGPLAAEYKACATQVGSIIKTIGVYKAKHEASVAASTSLMSFTVERPTFTAGMVETKAPCVGTGTATALKTSLVDTACTAYLGVSELNTAFGLPVADSEGFRWEKNNNPLEKILISTPSARLISQTKSVEAPKGIKLYLEKSLEFIFPKANAGVLASLGLASSALATYIATKKGLTQVIDSWMYTPKARMIAWTFMAGAALYGANQTDKEIKKVTGEIEEIDKILKDLGTLKKGIKANNVTEQQINLAAVNAMQAEETPLSVNSKEKMDCLVSAGKDKCTALDSTLKAMPGFADLPDSLKNIASQSAQLGDGLSGANSISSTTFGTANQLAGKQQAIAKLNNALKSKINSKLKQPIDFDKKANELSASLKATTQKALASKGTNGSAFLSSMGINPSTASAPPSANTASLNAKKPTSQSGANGGAGGNAKNKKDDFALEFKEAGIDGAGAATGDGGGFGNEKFDIGSNDINTNSGESIFQVISNRYIKSGYPRLLDEIPAAKN